MHHLWQGLRRHPATTALLSAVWLATWLVTVVTWKRDVAGHSIGMAPSAIALHLTLPLLVGIVVAGFGSPSPASRLKACALAGFCFGLLEFGILALVDLLWLPAAEAAPAVSEQAAGTAVGAILYATLCVVLSIVGGFVSAGVAARLHFRRAA